MNPLKFVKVGALVIALGFVAVVPGRSALLDAGSVGGDQATGGDRAVGPNVGPSQIGGKTGPVTVGGSKYECTRSRNGGKTAPGVTADRIHLASTVVQSGPGASFLAASPIGMQAVIRKVNREGGICGRLLELKLVDDGWDAQKGRTFLNSFIQQNYFALPVVPSSEGLTSAIEAGLIDRAGIPVVGSDGMLQQQYSSPWVWPVATATVSTMRIMVDHAYKKGIRKFGIVYDVRFRFGREGSDAFRKYVQTLQKKDSSVSLRADVGIFPARASYSSEIQRFNSACAKQCEFVAMLLEPQTALTWIAGRPQFGTRMTSGAQTLFNEQFAGSCGEPCQGMLVWTGYNPPIGNLAGLTDVRRYIDDVRSVDPKVDITNQFLEGAYMGMSIFVEALKKVGPELTRARLRAVLNSTCFPTEISARLCWRDGNTFTQRAANRTAQAFSIVVAQGSFAGFRNEQTGFIKDPLL